MAFLLVIPHALVGVFGLALFFILIYYQVSLYNLGEERQLMSASLRTPVNTAFQRRYNIRRAHVDFDFFYQLRFFIFFMACLYTTTFLPNGKYYLAVGGNESLLLSYAIILLHLSFPAQRGFITTKVIF
jgi:hypothetical protein